MRTKNHYNTLHAGTLTGLADKIEKAHEEAQSKSHYFQVLHVGIDTTYPTARYEALVYTVSQLEVLHG